MEPTKPFWASKTFWTIVIGMIVFTVNKYFAVGIPDELVAGVMGLLALIFRWNATQALGKTPERE